MHYIQKIFAIIVAFSFTFMQCSEKQRVRLVAAGKYEVKKPRVGIYNINPISLVIHGKKYRIPHKPTIQMRVAKLEKQSEKPGLHIKRTHARVKVAFQEIADLKERVERTEWERDAVREEVAALSLRVQELQRTLALLEIRGVLEMSDSPHGSTFSGSDTSE